MRRNKVCITQAAVLSPLGDGPSRLGDQLHSGANGIREISALPSTSIFRGELVPNVHIAGMSSLDLDPCEGAATSRVVLAFRRLLSQLKFPAGLEIDGLVLSSHGLKSDELASLFTRSNNPIRDLRDTFPTRSQLVNELANAGIRFRDGERILFYSSICSSGLVGAGIAYRRIRYQSWKRALVCCIDLIDHVRLVDLGGLGALSREARVDASRPFDKTRSGMVCSGGAALCVLEAGNCIESEQEAVSPEIIGFGQTSDAWKMTDGRPDGAMVALSMKTALTDASLEPRDISYIKAHGTSTFLGDKLEYEAMKSVFGELLPGVPITSLKSQLGHCTDASGLVELVACIEMIRRQEIFPMTTVQEVDSDFKLNLILNSSRPEKLNNILANSIGFGGHNASLIIAAPGR